MDTVVAALKKNLDRPRFEKFVAEMGEPFEERFQAYLKAFPDVEEALRAEVSRIRTAAFVPKKVKVYGLLYELSTGKLKLVVDPDLAS